MAVPVPVARDFSGTGKVLGRLVVLLANGELTLALAASSIIRVQQWRGEDGVMRTEIEYQRGKDVYGTLLLTPFAEVVRLWAEALGFTAGGG